MTKEDRIELLKKAREAKAMKKLEADALKPVAVKGRPPKKKVEKPDDDKTLDLTEVNEVNEVATEIKVKPVEIESEPEVVEEVIYEPKPKKKKKKIIRKIIKQVDSSSDEEVEEQIIYEKPSKRTQQAKVKPVEMPKEQPKPIEPEIRTYNPFFNY